MVDWTSDASLAKQGVVLSKVDMALFGLFLWECIVTLGYDIDVVTWKRPFKWPVILYWLTKYSTLAFTISVNIIDGTSGFLITPHAIQCQANSDIIDVAARFAMAGASGLLMLRAIALWNRDLRVTVPLVVLHLAQWGFYLHNAFITEVTWSDELQGCYTTSITLPWLKAQFIYTMIFDGLVLAAASWTLARLPGRTTLWKLLFLDGLSYYIGVFLMYFTCMLVAFLNPSPFFLFIFSDLATVVGSILACRSFVRIATYTYSDDVVAGAHLPNSGAAIAFKSQPPSSWGLSGRWKTNSEQTDDSAGSRGTQGGLRSSEPAALEMIPVTLPPRRISRGTDIESQDQKA